jgi:hypothetical protein
MRRCRTALDARESVSVSQLVARPDKQPRGHAGHSWRSNLSGSRALPPSMQFASGGASASPHRYCSGRGLPYGWAAYCSHGRARLPARAWADRRTGGETRPALGLSRPARMPPAPDLRSLRDDVPLRQRCHAPAGRSETPVATTHTGCSSTPSPCQTSVYADVDPAASCLCSASCAQAIQASAISINMALSLAAARSDNRLHSAAYWRKRLASSSMTVPSLVPVPIANSMLQAASINWEHGSCSSSSSRSRCGSSSEP